MEYNTWGCAREVLFTSPENGRDTTLSLPWIPTFFHRKCSKWDLCVGTVGPRRSGVCVGLGSSQLCFQARIWVHMKHSSPTCSETELSDFSFLLVANGILLRKMLVLLSRNCSQICYLLKSCLDKKCIKVYRQNQRKKLCPFSSLSIKDVG